MSAHFVRRHRQFLINLTSASGLMTLGDLCAQVFYEKKKPLDNKRLIGATLTGAAMGIEGHFWYTFLDRVIPQATWRNAFKKVFLDQTLAVPVYTMTYILGTSVVEGRASLSALQSDTRMNFVPLYLADCAVFIPVQLFNFRFMPSHYRVPFMFAVAFVFNTFLSAYKHAHEE